MARTSTKSSKSPKTDWWGSLASGFIQSKLSKLTRKQTVVIVLAALLVVGTAYTLTHRAESVARPSKPDDPKPAPVGTTQIQTGDGQQQNGGGGQQRTGTGNITNTLNFGPQPTKETPADKFRTSLKSLTDSAGGQVSLFGNRTAAVFRQKQVEGVLRGIELFQATAVSVQTRFDEGEANRGRDAFNGQTQPMREAASQTVTAEQATVRAGEADRNAAKARIDSTLTDLSAQLVEAAPGSDKAAEGKRLIDAIRSQIDARAALAEQLAVVAGDIGYNTGVVAGATDHQQRFFDIMHGMDREEAHWSRHGGEERAPAGGYTRLVDEQLAAHRKVVQDGPARRAELDRKFLQATESISDAVTRLRGLTTAVFQTK